MEFKESTMKTLFLHPPSFDGFDGGAGARYQAKREIRSFWYPTWLAQPAALVPGSTLIDAPADGTPIEDVLAEGKELRSHRSCTRAHRRFEGRARRGAAQGGESRGC
jgi:hypothetical protein